MLAFVFIAKLCDGRGIKILDVKLKEDYAYGMHLTPTNRWPHPALLHLPVPCLLWVFSGKLHAELHANKAIMPSNNMLSKLSCATATPHTEIQNKRALGKFLFWQTLQKTRQGCLRPDRGTINREGCATNKIWLIVPIETGGCLKATLNLLFTSNALM